jgi:fructose-1,6-bisphosphatase/sedoheptulose 1,7-bisphosphatase-like protein
MMMMMMIIITKTKRENMHTDRYGDTRRQKCREKEAEKMLKYKNLGIEIQRMWNLKCTIIPLIIGATGIVTKSLRKNLEAIPGKLSIHSLQKTAVTGTSHMIRKVLQCGTAGSREVPGRKSL